MAGFIIMDFKFSSNTSADNEVASLKPADKVEKRLGSRAELWIRGMQVFRPVGKRRAKQIHFL